MHRYCDPLFYVRIVFTVYDNSQPFIVTPVRFNFPFMDAGDVFRMNVTTLVRIGICSQMAYIDNLIRKYRCIKARPVVFHFAFDQMCNRSIAHGRSSK